MNRFSATNEGGALVRGYWWKARMSNGALFELWTPNGDVKQKEARKTLLDFANSSCSEDNPAYYPEDVEGVWRAVTPGDRKS